MRRLLLSVFGLCICLFLGTSWVSLAQSDSGPRPVAQGTGGAVASVDAAATQVGIDILRAGGNAVDAAVATAAALGVTEPFSAGVGGGGFMLIYQPAEQSVISLDGREEAPAAVTPDLFRDPESATGEPLPFFPNRISSGLAVGVPGTPLNWATAVERYGTMPLANVLEPAIALAENGFEVDQTFVDQITVNQERFSAFESTRNLYLPGGKAPSVGSRLVNVNLAKTYRLLADRGVNAFYRGEIGEAIAQTVRTPPVVSNPPFPVWPGRLSTRDLDRYEVRVRPAVVTPYRDYSVYGMGLPSSGGITIAQALNLLSDDALLSMDRADALRLLIEAERVAFADRNAYIGDPEYVDVPVEGLLDPDYAMQRRQIIPPTVPPNEASYRAPAGNPLPYQRDPSPSLSAVPVAVKTADAGGVSTTHLTVVDKDGMVVSYTLTIESTGGSGIVVPGYGFILNNELTDFNTENPHPNVPEPGKRPRSSMSPTILFSPEGEIVAFGSPGGSTIITTVLGITVNLVDFRMSLADAIAAPRLSQRNQGITLVDQDFELTEAGRQLSRSGYQLQPTAEIGAATGIVMVPDGSMVAVAEPTRRGGGSAQTLSP